MGDSLMHERRRVAFTTLGCKVNQYDTASLTSLFLREGYEVVSFDSTAHIYIINTCTVTTMAAQKSRRLIRQAKKRNPDALVVAAGCYPQAQREEVESLEEVDLLIGTKGRRDLLEFIESSLKGNHVRDFLPHEPFEEMPGSYPQQTRAYLKIQEGCIQGCTYCIVPKARGPLRSRGIESILKEATALLKENYKELVLTGVHLGAYGEGMEYGLLDVIQGILSLDDSFRLRLSSLEITEVEEGLIQLLSVKNPLTPHLHLPLQSGSSRIVERMGRPYTPGEYLNKTNYLKRMIPDLSITTDIMVGFPGETPEDFLSSCQLAEEVGFSHIHAFPYSLRPETEAASMKDQVPSTVKRERIQSLQTLSKKLKKRFYEKYLGQVVEVLVEEGRDGILQGLTPNYCRVFFKGAQSLQGSFLPVYLHGLTDDRFCGTIHRRRSYDA